MFRTTPGTLADDIGCIFAMLALCTLAYAILAL